MRVLIADDHPLFRLGLALSLDAEGFDVVGKVEDGRMAVERCAQGGIDVVLLDIRMPEVDGVEACRRITSLPDAPIVVMLTTFEEPAIIRAARDAGATAYLSKETEPRHLAARLRAIAAEPERDWLPAIDLPSLTRRESEVLQLLGRGMTNKGIAKQLGLSPDTVKDYVVAVFDKLDVHDRVSALRRATELGLVAVGSLNDG